MTEKGSLRWKTVGNWIAAGAALIALFAFVSEKIVEKEHKAAEISEIKTACKDNVEDIKDLKDDIKEIKRDIKELLKR